MADASERQVKLTVDAGGEQIDLIRVEAAEALSQHFQVTIDVLAPLGEIDWLPHLGKPAVVAVSEDDELQRHFHGIVVDASFLDETHGAGFSYRLTLRPKAFLHEQGRSFRIFQKMSVKAILQDMLSRCGIAAEFGSLEGGTRNRDYCVQYGESDFGFVCRLMEEEGIYYFYRHGAGGHILVLCGSPNAHHDGSAAKLTYNPDTSAISITDSAARTSAARKQFVQEWHERVSTGGESKVTMRDFDFISPNKALEVQSSAEGDHPDDAIEVYTYPGRFYVSDDGKALTETILRARRANRRTFSGETRVGSLTCGTTFKLEKHPHDRFNAKYLVTYAHHSIASELYRSGMDQSGSHVVTFEVIPADVPWRAPLTTRRPIVAGPETAIVTGPAGEDIHVDRYGRVRIQFHWDRDGKLDDKSSCWVRVSQTGGLGNIIIPRVGHEVLVDFINGDPDRPIVVGRVFNASHMPVYALPEHKTKAVWRTKRYKDTGTYDKAESLDVDPAGVNEIRLDDKGGSEEFFIYAERLLNTRIRLDETHHVGRDQDLQVLHDRKKFVKYDEHIKVDEHREAKIGKTDTLEILNKLTTKITSGDEEREVSNNQKITVGKEIEIEAGTSITINVGSSKIVIDKTSITVEAMTLLLNGKTQAELKSLNTTVSGSAMTTVAGGIVKIN